MEVAQKIENSMTKAFVLRDIASALAMVKAGDKEQALATLKQAVEVAQKIEDAGRKAPVLSGMALMLATDPIPENKKDNSSFPFGGRMKTAFTPKEKQLAKQLVEAIQGN